MDWTSGAGDRGGGDGELEIKNLYPFNSSAFDRVTTPAWTPLFARAAAVVTDVGGPLSHGSIVAREYGIPAVLGTGAATRRIRSGQVIIVDGSAGVVTLLKNGESNE